MNTSRALVFLKINFFDFFISLFLIILVQERKQKKGTTFTLWKNLTLEKEETQIVKLIFFSKFFFYFK